MSTDFEVKLRQLITAVADEAAVRPGHEHETLNRIRTSRRTSVVGISVAAILLIGAAWLADPFSWLATALDDRKNGAATDTVRSPDARGKQHSDQAGLTASTLRLQDQPLALDGDSASVWVATGMGQLLQISDGRIAERYRAPVARGIAVEAGTVWLTGGGDGANPTGAVVAVDASSGRVVQTLELPGEAPYGVDTGATATYVAIHEGDLARVDRTGDITRVPLSEGLTQVLVDAGQIWVAEPDDGRVWRVPAGLDTEPSAVDLVANPRGPSCPQGLTSGAGVVWVADSCAGVVWVLDVSGKVLDRIDNVGTTPVDVAFSGRFVYVSSTRDRLVTQVDARTYEVVATGRSGRGASAIFADSNGSWVANLEGFSLTRLEPE